MIPEKRYRERKYERVHGTRIRIKTCHGYRLIKAQATHGDVLLGVLEVFEEGVLVPGDALLLVALRVGESGNLTSLATEEAVEVGADLVGTAL